MPAASRVIPFGFDRVFEATAAAPFPDAAGALSGEAVAKIAALQAAMDAQTELHAIELRRAQEEAFDAGFGHAANAQNAALLAAVDALQDMLADIDDRVATAADEMKEDAADVAFVAAELLAGHAVAAAPARAIGEALGRALRQVARGTHIDIHVHPDLLDALTDCVEDHKGETRRKLSIAVIADATIPPGDARLGWEGGGLSVDAAARRQAVLDELAPLMITWPEAKENAPARIA